MDYNFESVGKSEDEKGSSGVALEPLLSDLRRISDCGGGDTLSGEVYEMSFPE